MFVCVLSQAFIFHFPFSQTRFILTYIFKAKKVDKKFWEIAENYMENRSVPIQFMKRFLDDFFKSSCCVYIKPP